MEEMKWNKERKFLTSSQMLQRKAICLAPLKIGKTFQNKLNEICKIIYSLSQA